MYEKPYLSEGEYESLKARYDEYERARAAICKSPTVITQEEIELLPPDISNENRSRMEIYEFLDNPPARYFAYVKVSTYKAPSYITTWTGEKLGDVISYGKKYKSNMGDTRQNLEIRGINGKVYYAVYYYSAGDYCRMRIKKS